jgi:hypothetical protein
MVLQPGHSIPKGLPAKVRKYGTYMAAGLFGILERSNPPQTFPEASQHPRQAPADKVEQCITQHVAASGNGNS